jgi:DNA modification methylase
MKSKVFYKTSEDMSIIEDNSIQLMVTSPPYWDLKNYKVDNQIGYKEGYETYLGRLYKVWQETYRVLKDNGIAIININTKSKKKSLVLIPLDFIRQMEKLEFHYQDTLIWHKSSGIPRIKNFGDHFEYFLIFSKNNSFKATKNKKIKTRYNVKDVNTDRLVNMWNINKKFGSIAKKYSKVHPALFPVKFITRLIKLFTDKGDIVLDPFLGSGTTLYAAIKTGRYCYGYELNKKDYSHLIKGRLIEDDILVEKYVEFIQ